MSQRFQHQEGRWLSAAIGIFVFLTCLRVWFGPFSVAEPAAAQIPDAGAQRLRQVEEAQRTNQLLSEIKTILAERTLKVRLEGADNQTDAPRKPPVVP